MRRSLSGLLKGFFKVDRLNVFSRSMYFTGSVFLCSEASARRFPPNLSRRFVGSEPDVDRVAQESVSGPGQIGELAPQI